MAFFDNVVNKLTSSSQTVVQKTKDLTELTMLTAQVNDAEKKINDLYYKLGFEVYKAHREEPLEAGAEYFAQITELHQQIAEFKEQMSALNPAPVCPSCGARVSKDMIFCSGCAAWQASQALPDTHVVASGDATVGGGWRRLPNYYDMRDCLGMYYMN